MILDVKNLKKVYTSRFGGVQVKALSNISFSVEQGEYIAIMGESGSGKTTLLNILASLDKPTSGEVLLKGSNMMKIKENELAEFRRNNLGFVFQDFNLLDTFSIQENIFLPLVLSGKSYKEIEEELGADKVIYLEIDDLKKSIGLPSTCMACLDNKYPTKISAANDFIQSRIKPINEESSGANYEF